MKKFEITLFYHHNRVATRWIDADKVPEAKEKALKSNPTWRTKLLKSKHYWVGAKRVR